MASSNRHWPSLFKSKPHQWQHEVSSSIVSNGCHRSSSCSSEERTPEPKPRWNPRPEQIRILESIFDSGMVNPPRDEIRKIRAQLQEYGQVGDANVFYWFQNRKSRSKHKLRNSSKQQRHQLAAPSSSSSSSEKKSSPGSDLSKEGGILTEPFLFQGSGFFLPEGLYGGGSVEGGTFLAGEMTNHGGVKKVKTMTVSTPNTTTTTAPVPVPECPSSSCAAAAAAAASSVSVTVPFLPSISTHHPLHASRPTTNVFINDIAIEVVADEPFNVRTTFGDEAVLVTASGQAVLTDDWGVTLHPLHPNAFFYLI